MPSPGNAMSITENTEETFRQDFFCSKSGYRTSQSGTYEEQVVAERKMLQATQIVAMKP